MYCQNMLTVNMIELSNLPSSKHAMNSSRCPDNRCWAQGTPVYQLMLNVATQLRCLSNDVHHVQAVLPAEEHKSVPAKQEVCKHRMVAQQLLDKQLKMCIFHMTELTYQTAVGYHIYTTSFLSFQHCGRRVLRW